MTEDGTGLVLSGNAFAMMSPMERAAYFEKAAAHNGEYIRYDIDNFTLNFNAANASNNSAGGDTGSFQGTLPPDLGGWDASSLRP